MYEQESAPVYRCRCLHCREYAQTSTLVTWVRITLLEELVHWSDATKNPPTDPIIYQTQKQLKEVQNSLKLVMKTG